MKYAELFQEYLKMKHSEVIKEIDEILENDYLLYNPNKLSEVKHLLDVHYYKDYSDKRLNKRIRDLKKVVFDKEPQDVW
jgi:hypothetical protein